MDIRPDTRTVDTVVADTVAKGNPNPQNTLKLQPWDSTTKTPDGYRAYTAIVRIVARDGICFLPHASEAYETPVYRDAIKEALGAIPDAYGPNFYTGVEVLAFEQGTFRVRGNDLVVDKDNSVLSTILQYIRDIFPGTSPTASGTLATVPGTSPTETLYAVHVPIPVNRQPHF